MFAAKDRPPQHGADSSRPFTLAAPTRTSGNLHHLQNTRPLFSYSYKMLLPQLPCFHIHVVCPGGVPPPFYVPHFQLLANCPSAAAAHTPSAPPWEWAILNRPARGRAEGTGERSRAAGSHKIVSVSSCAQALAGWAALLRPAPSPSVLYCEMSCKQRTVTPGETHESP